MEDKQTVVFNLVSRVLATYLNGESVCLNSVNTQRCCIRGEYEKMRNKRISESIAKVKAFSKQLDVPVTSLLGCGHKKKTDPRLNRFKFQMVKNRLKLT